MAVPSYFMPTQVIMRLAGTLGLLCGALSACSVPAYRPTTLEIKNTTQYRPGVLQNRKVAFLPLAVTDELGDQRSGLVLSKHTRTQSSKTACTTLADYWDDLTVVCLSEADIGSSAVTEVQQRFALDQPFTLRVWQALREKSQAEYVLLVRPEGASSSQEVERRTIGRGTSVALGVGGGVASNVGSQAMQALGTSMLVAGLLSTPAIRRATVNTTDVTYTLSASLVDLRTGRLLRVGVYTDGDSNTVLRNQGYAEGPPIGPILERIMLQLGRWVLEENLDPNLSDPTP